MRRRFEPHEGESGLEATLSKTMSNLDLDPAEPDDYCLVSEDGAERLDEVPRERSQRPAQAAHATTARAPPDAVPTAAAVLTVQLGPPSPKVPPPNSPSVARAGPATASAPSERYMYSPIRTVPRPLVQEADPATAGARFGLTKLGETAAKLPCPVLTWVAGTVYCIATDSEISGSDESLSGIQMAPVVLGDGPDGPETGLMLRFNDVLGPKGDLICRIARKVMEIKAGKKDMFQDWSALRKHLCDSKTLRRTDGGPKIKNFSFLWSGSRKGGNIERGPMQTYYERRFTAGLRDDVELTEKQREEDRMNGGGGNPGLLAHCGFLLQRDEPGLYKRAKEAALMDIVNGMQVITFEDQLRKKVTLSAAEANPPPKGKERKRFNKTKADARNAESHVKSAKATREHPDLLRWEAQRKRRRSASSETHSQQMPPPGEVSPGEASPPGEVSPQGP